MKTICSILLCCLCLVSCCGQKKNNDLRLSLLFYPSMAKEDIRYSIDIINDSLITKKYHIGVETMRKIHLTDEQWVEVKRRISLLTRKYDKSKNFVKGGWGCTLKVGDQIYYVDNLFSFQTSSTHANFQPTPEEMKLLIDYIVSLSPILIELYSFS